MRRVLRGAPVRRSACLLAPHPLRGCAQRRSRQALKEEAKQAEKDAERVSRLGIAIEPGRIRNEKERRGSDALSTYLTRDTALYDETLHPLLAARRDFSYVSQKPFGVSVVPTSRTAYGGMRPVSGSHRQRASVGPAPTPPEALVLDQPGRAIPGYSPLLPPLFPSEIQRGDLGEHAEYCQHLDHDGVSFFLLFIGRR